MNMRHKSLGISLAVGGLSFATVLAQPADVDPAPHEFCGTVVSDEQIANELEWQAAGLFDGGAVAGTGDFKYVRVAIHIVRYSNGTGGISPAEIQIGLDQANDEFANSEIVFIPIHRDFIDSDTYATLTEPEGDLLRGVNVVAGALNIYFVPSAPYCGQATFPAGTPSGGGPQGIIMQNSCTTAGGILSHEIGHYLLLYHTHETAFGSDCPSGGNCSARGDLVCDTPPDPGLHTCDGNLGSCVDNCAYTGSATCNGVTYAPNVRNTMSYTDPECMLGFSAGQEGRIATAIALPDRSDEVAFEHPCGRPAYAQPGSGTGLGIWAAPDFGLRAGIVRSDFRCGNPEGGVVIAIRGNYFEGTGVFDTPVTIVASREGTGDVVIRP